MKRLLCATVIAGSMAPLLADGVGKDTGLLKARIVQLESQLVQVEAARAVCEARISQAQALQTKPAIEKEAGCSIDWTAVPPKCKE